MLPDRNLVLDRIDSQKQHVPVIGSQAEKQLQPLVEVLTQHGIIFEQHYRRVTLAPRLLDDGKVRHRAGNAAGTLGAHDLRRKTRTFDGLESFDCQAQPLELFAHETPAVGSAPQIDAIGLREHIYLRYSAST